MTAPVAPTLAVLSLTFTLSGNEGEPQDPERPDIIALYDDQAPDPTVPVTTTAVNADGTWVAQITLSRGNVHTITATATNAAGQVSPVSGNMMIDP